MAKPRNSFEVMARDAAQRIDEARQMGQQLTFLGDEAGAPVVDTVERKAGRPAGAKSKGSNQMREWLADRGYRMPEDVLAQMAGLASGPDAMVAAMEAAERVLTWAYTGAGRDKDGNAILPSPNQRLAMFAQLYTTQLRAAEALLPYGTPKASPDVQVQDNRTFILAAQPSSSGDRAASARDITPPTTRRMMPADVARQIERNQEVSEGEADAADDGRRTQEPSHGKYEGKSDAEPD
ncbi:hypothetical protein [Pseudooceanicola sp.]|uniref:hypothetical protein n=1 Tax=Pseudooceanicola sp. TaxID=1914328 RepID=UPI0040592268